MNLGISIKIIFSSFLFINFIQPIGSAELYKNNKKVDKQYLKISKNKNTPNSSNLHLNNLFEDTKGQKKNPEKNSDLLLAELNNKKEELVIQSDEQTENNNVIYAKGNALVSFRGKFLKADKISFNKSSKKIIAEGNINLVFGEQIFKMSKLEYDFKKEKGFLLEVKGSINSDKLINDISKKFHKSDIQKLDYLLSLQKKKVLNTPDKVNNWIFYTERINIDGRKWMSDKAIFSNDILEFKQVKIEINSLEVYPLKEELRFRSSLNYLVLDENVSVPFWLGNRALTKSDENFDSKSSWTIGYDNLDKDGLFIGRKFIPINLDDNFVIDLEPQFLIQRSLNGQTKSFVKKGDLVTEEKVARDTSFADYLGFESQIRGTVNNWDLEITNQINSSDPNKFSDAFRTKSILSKEVSFFNAKWDKSFYGVYRDRVWNGSLGEAEIYTGFGSKLEKKHTWEVNGITNTEVLNLGLAYLKAEELISKNLVDSYKSNLFYSLDQKIPLVLDKPKNKIIDNSYEYIYAPITKGLSINTRLAALYSLYADGKHQEYIGLGFGPELILGNFKTKTFDYTRISIFPFYKFKNGDSVFKFDQISDKITLDISFDQQLFGPIILKSNGTLNLDDDSNDYGKFINSKVSINWKKRSYEFGIFYKPHNQAGGITFNLFGFK